MLAKRIIPCLDVTGGRVVKGVNFVELRDAGDPVEIAARYNDHHLFTPAEVREAHRPVAEERLERRGLGHGHPATAHVGALGDAEPPDQATNRGPQPGGLGGLGGLSGPDTKLDPLLHICIIQLSSNLSRRSGSLTGAG